MDLCIGCMSNDEKQLNEKLLSSIDIGNVDIVTEAISAPQGLNQLLKRATSDLIMLIHQDVILNEGWRTQLETILQNLSDMPWGVLGVAGITEKGIPVGRYSKDGKVRNINGYAREVLSLDEQLLILNAKNGLQFDGALQGFHLYGLDICLQSIERGFKNYVIDIPTTHKGTRPYPDFSIRKDVNFLTNKFYLQEKYAHIPLLSLSLYARRGTGRDGLKF